MTNDGRSGIKNHPVVSPEEWLSARTAFLAKEKEFMRLRDELNRQRRALPGERSTSRTSSMGRAAQRPWPSSSRTGATSHLSLHVQPRMGRGVPALLVLGRSFRRHERSPDHRDVTMVVISRAPLAKIEPFKKRMGWKFKW